jgi:pimeloyl-ACP methyl ester carboxylesterase
MVLRILNKSDFPKMDSKISIQPAKLISEQTYIAPKSLLVTELFFQVPLDYSQPDSRTITLFAHRVTQHCTSKEDSAEPKRYLVYLEGGPGFGNAPPQDHPLTATALAKGYQLLLLDHRGTGLSTPVSTEMLSELGDADAQANYLKLMRQDNTVRDCEAVRKCLTEGWPEHLQSWSAHGQSYGGFISMSYLSMHPEGLKEVFLTGGLPPIGVPVDEVYRKTFGKAIERNQAYFSKFPQDTEAIIQIISFVKSSREPIVLPGGGFLTPQRLMTLGYAFGMHGGFDMIHSIILRLKTSLDQFGFLSRASLSSVETSIPFDDNIIYAILHEAIYCDGPIPSAWSASRVGKQTDGYWWLKGDQEKSRADEPLYFSGEHVFPFHFDTYAELRPLKEVAEKLAHVNDWPPLYDVDRLRKNEVPVYAASFIEDLYVNYELASRTAKLVKNTKVFETNLLYHNALRAKTDEVLPRLFSLRDEVID